MEICPIGVDAKGNVDIGQLREKAAHYKDRCAADCLAPGSLSARA